MRLLLVLYDGIGKTRGSTVLIDPSDVTGGEGLFLAIAALSEKVPDGDFEE